MASGSPNDNPWLRFWLEAALEPLGLFLSTPNPRRLMAQLYNARMRAAPSVLEAISHLQIRTSPRDPNGEIWIVNTPKDEDQA